MLATNELPPAFRNDIRGSVWRRLLPFPYPNEISPLDPQLKKRILETEIPGILRKAACAYLAHDRTRDIMTNPLPPEVEQERNKLQRASNSLIDYLMSEDHVLLDPDKMVERGKFIKAYGGFCKNVRRCKPSNFHEDFTRVPFLKMGLREEVHDQKQYIVGCELMLTYEQHNEGDL
jgi:phage/plasmid-associated DNA primase